MSQLQKLYEFEPGPTGQFDEFGGSYIPEILHETIAELRCAFDAARKDPLFWDEYVQPLFQRGIAVSVA